MALFRSYMFLMLVISFTSTYAVNTKLVIDSDAGADDAMAIFIALNYQKYFKGPELVAITTTHGNVDEDQALLNLQRILRTAGRQEVPLYRGANFSLVQNVPTDNFFGTDGLGNTAYDHSPIPLVPAKSIHAAQALLDYSKLYDGKLEVVALGVLTNIALAVRLDPQFLSRLRHLYIGAGNVYSETYASPEFNALGDVEAYRAVVESAHPDRATVLPFSQVRLLNITKEWRNNILGAIPTQVMRTQNEYERTSLSTSSTLWDRLDPAVVAIVLKPSLVLAADYVDHNIITCGASRGINTNKVVSRQKANVELVQKLDVENYMKFLLEVFSVGK